MRLSVAGVAVPSAALSLSLPLAHAPWYAWLSVALASLAVLVYSYRLDHREKVLRLRIEHSEKVLQLHLQHREELQQLRTHQDEVAANLAVRLEEFKVKSIALDGIEKVQTKHSAQLMASIADRGADLDPDLESDA